MPESEANGLQRIEHVVVDHWRSSVPGAIWLNRLYAQGRMLAVNQAAREQGHPADQP